jgi:hypothetical protein
MSRDPFAGGAFDPGGFANPTGGGGDDSDGGGDDSDGGGDDSGGGGGGDPRGIPTGGFGGGDEEEESDDRTRTITSPSFDPGGFPGGGGDDDSSGSSPGGSSPPPSDVGGPSGPAPTPDPDTDSGTDSGPQFGPGPGTGGGLGDPDPGGDGGEIVDDVREFVDDAEATDEIVERATTGGLLSERGESAGLFPATLGDGGGAAIGDGRVDISETRLRELAEDSLAFGQSIDAGAAFTSPADPLGYGGLFGPTAGDPGPADPTTDPAPGTENPAEEAIEGAAAVPFDLPGAALETETATEAGQALVADDLVEDFGAGTVGETATAQGRKRAERTADAIKENPGGFAGAVAASAFVGAGGLSRGSTGTLGQAVRAEVDPRIGPFGTTAETKAFRRFLGDDRGQAQLVPESRDRDGGTDTATDDDLGPNVGPFDRSDARLFDPNRQFGDDLGGMADDGPTVDPSDASSRQDIGAGIGGQGSPDLAPGVDADSFSSRGFGNVEGTELDPNPTSTVTDSFSSTGAGAGGLFGVPESEPATGADAAGLLGTPGGFDSTGTTPDLGERTRTVTTPFFDGETDTPTDLGGRTRTVTTPFFDGETDTPTDLGGRTRTVTTPFFDGETDTPTDTGQDTPTDLFDRPTDGPTDRPTDGPTDQPTDQPTDTPTDIPTDQPTDRPTDFPFGGDEDRDDEVALFGTVAESRTVDSGFLSGGEALDDLYGGDGSDPFRL